MFPMFSREENMNHEKFDSDIIKSCLYWRLFAHGEVLLADVGIVPALVKTGAGCLLPLNRTKPELLAHRIGG